MLICNLPVFVTPHQRQRVPSAVSTAFIARLADTHLLMSVKDTIQGAMVNFLSLVQVRATMFTCSIKTETA